MDSGIIPLKPLYEHVLKDLSCNREEDHDYCGQNPWINTTPLWKRYTACYSALVTPALVPETPGWYLWGCYSTGMKTWKSIYVGISKNLFSRIKKELNAEREFIYIQRYSIQQIHRFVKEAFPNTYVKFNRNADRAIKKMGTTFIFWVAAPENITNDLANLNNNLKHIESGLIDFFDPLANSDKAPLPNPPDRQNNVLRSISGIFKEHIKETRDKDYSDDFDFIHSRFGGD